MTARRARAVQLRPLPPPAPVPVDEAAEGAWSRHEQPVDVAGAIGSEPGGWAPVTRAGGAADRSERPVPWRAAAAVAAAVVLGASAGDGFVAVLLVLVAGGLPAGGPAALAVAATVARWGTADLGAVAGDQAVLGAAALTGDLPDAASSALAALALLLAARRGGGRWPLALPVALGAGAAALAAGPAVGEPADLAVRVVATVLGAALALVVARVAAPGPGLDRRLTLAATAAGVLALALAAPS